MKYETNECNVIKDLLPNYMENLVSEDTRTYIENHLKECKECRQVFETIKDEQKQERMNSKQKEKKEIDYLKKYKNKKLIIKSVFLIGMNVSSLTSSYFSNEAEELSSVAIE